MKSSEFPKSDEQRQKSYDNLEKLVEQRTAELKKSNEELTQEIQERKRIEEDLITAKDIAESAVRARSAFLANMSHEIRTPMNAILGFADLLESRVRDPESRGYLKSILTSGTTLLRLINDILDLSKVEAGKLDLEYRAFDPRTMMTEIMDIFRPALSKKNVEFKTELDTGLPSALMLDEVRLRQVLLNLIGNAVKFTDTGYVQVSMFIRNMNEDKSVGELVILVEDTGMGIPAGQTDRIFDAFRQQDGQDLGKYGGTGLGLTITKRLVNLMGGTITVTSNVGKRTIFEVRLRSVKVVPESDISLEYASSNIDSLHFNISRILVVDDNRLNRLLCTKYLSRSEFELFEAVNGREALDIAKVQHLDMILLDIKMPEMDGYETLTHLKKDDRLSSIPVIALTASAMPDDEVRMLKAGCDGYLRKPLSKQVLMKEIYKYLGKTLGTDVSCEEDDITDVIPTSINDMPEETRQNIPGVLVALEGELYTRWDAIRKTYVIGSIETFAKDVRCLAERYNLGYLVTWADILYKQARAFDMENLQGTLNQYPDLIDAMKKNIYEES